MSGIDHVFRRSGQRLESRQCQLAKPAGIVHEALTICSALTHYLKVVRALGPARAKESGRATVAAMKEMPTDDDCFGPGSIREDGRKIHPAYLFRVKTPEESHYAGDVYAHLATTPARDAFRPIADGGCAMIHT